jgi:hypothetical protein
MLQQKIREDLKDAMRAKDELKLNVVRGFLSAFTNELVSKKRKPQDELSDEEVTTVLQRLVKQRKDSIDQYTAGGRADLAQQEEAEMKIIETYLPEMMSYEAILEAVKNKQQELGATDKTKSNMLMGSVMKDLKGKADGTLVKKAVDSLFE